MRLILVEWVDSATYGGWHHITKGDCISNCITIGILHNETDKQITIVQSKSDTGNYAESISIPKVSIKRIRELRVHG